MNLKGVRSLYSPHDEGPDKDGGFGAYVQSERVESGLYLKYAKEIIGKEETLIRVMAAIEKLEKSLEA